MKHPQPGVGCGPCDWAVEGYSLDNCPLPPLHLLGHATTHQTPNTLNLNNISSNNKNSVARRDMKLERVAEAISRADRHPSEAVRRYRAAFPALRGESAEAAMAAAPAWCRERAAATQREEATLRAARPRARRNSFHGRREGAAAKRRCRSFGKPARAEREAAPEWLEEGECDWDMETQDPVRAFVRALAREEGLGARPAGAVRPLECRALEGRQREAAEAARRAPEDASLARFRAKFHRGLEALWGPPDHSCRDASAEPFSPVLPPSPRNIWSYERPAERLHDELAPLNIEEAEEAPRRASVERSLEALNHDRRLSSFSEVAPARRGGCVGEGRPPARRPPPPAAAPEPPDDPLSSARTHFRPIRPDAEGPGGGRTADGGYADGATFAGAAGAPERLTFARSGSGAMLLHSHSAEPPKRYMEYRADSPDRADRPDCADRPDRFVLKFQVKQIEKAVQTDDSEDTFAFGFGSPRRRDERRFDDAQLVSRIWGGGDCPAVAAPARPAARADDDSDWEELLSDIGWRRAASPGIAAHEPSFCAPDGDFASALRAAERHCERKRRCSAGRGAEAAAETARPPEAPALLPPSFFAGLLLHRPLTR